ncbi:hypothetical protein GCM10020331_035430 [Ectobacillus funiculus]
MEWLQQKVKEANANGAIVGISGGIDSAVVTHLIKRAFPDQSLGLIMPCKKQSKGSGRCVTRCRKLWD